MNKLDKKTFVAWAGGVLLGSILLLFFPKYFIVAFVVGVSAVLYFHGPHGENQTGKYVESEQTNEHVESEAGPPGFYADLYRNVIVPTEVDEMIVTENAAHEHIT